MTPTLLQGHPWFGSGVDGDCTIVGATDNYTSPLGDNLIVAGVLQRDASFNSLTINAGGTLDAAPVIGGLVLPCAVLATQLIDIEGTLLWTPASASGFTGGVGGAGRLTALLRGNSGTTGSGTAGSGGVAWTGLGSPGGKGGDGTGGRVGGAASLASTGIALDTALAYLFGNQGIVGGSQGGAGAGDGTNKGGGSGTGGAVGIIGGATITTLNGTVRIKGGDGGTPPAGNCGGGGGGGGGAPVFIYDGGIDTTGLLGYDSGTDSVYILGTLDLAGGAKGLKVGTGTDGTNGTDGSYAYSFDISKLLGSRLVSVLAP